MAKVIITLKIMPESPEAPLHSIESKSIALIKAFAGDVETKTEITPVAFGLKSVNIKFVLDESKGGTDKLEDQIAEIPDVNSVEVTDVRRIIG
jgi:elongation factor 1-beta